MIRVSIDADISQTDIQVGQIIAQTTPTSLQNFLMGAARSFLQHRVDARFAAEGDDVSGKWAPLRPATGGIRAALGYRPFHPINVRSGELYKFVRNTFRIRIDPASTVLTMPGDGNARVTEKFRVAQKGGGKSKVKGSRSIGPNRPAPPRPVIGLSATDERALTQLLMEHIKP